MPSPTELDTEIPQPRASLSSSISPAGPGSSNPQSDQVTVTVKRQVIPPLIPYLDDLTAPLNLATFRVIFPLSPDHHLITLMQYNVLRATMTNLAILSLLEQLPIECGAAREVIALLPVPGTIPPNFRPTPLQLSAPHPYWIDALPDPALRDNLIRFQGDVDEDELCQDLCGGLYDGFDEIDLRGILVWGDSWRPDGWEVTEGFLRKWGFVLRGCDEIMDATNKFRAARGEEPLVVEM
jgi:uncharacterized protein DUF3425